MKEIITKEYEVSQFVDGFTIPHGLLTITAQLDSVIEDHAVIDYKTVNRIMKLILGKELYHHFGDKDNPEINNGILKLFDDVFVTRTKNLKEEIKTAKKWIKVEK